MRRLTVFNSVSLDGYFTDARGDMSWAHRGDDPQWRRFVAGNARGGGTFLFGRVTYELMARFWPTPQASAAMPEVARQINALPKVVFSRRLRKAAWSHTTLVGRGLVAAVKRLKAGDGDGLVVLGSGSLVAQLAAADLVDEYQLVVVPVVLGAGRTLFAGLKRRAVLRLVRCRRFRNGNVLLCYQA